MSTKFLTTWVLAAIALSSALVSVAAQEGKVQNLGFVQKLGSSEFKKTPLAQPGLWYIEFMSEDCGACEEFKDDWTKVAEQLQGKAMVGVVDCPKNMQLQEVFEISEYPSFRIIDLTDPGEGTVYEFPTEKRSVQNFKTFADEYREKGAVFGHIRGFGMTVARKSAGPPAREDCMDLYKDCPDIADNGKCGMYMESCEISCGACVPITPPTSGAGAREF